MNNKGRLHNNNFGKEKKVYEMSGAILSQMICKSVFQVKTCEVVEIVVVETGFGNDSR